MNQSIAMRMGRVEFIAFCAMLSATVAFSIDSMLPGLPEIAKELTPQDTNKAQLVLTSFVLGMGLGTFIVGPLSDRFGRKLIMLIGSILYCIAAFVAWRAQSLEILLGARVVQGVGAAGPRIVSMAVVRDLFSGREMAKIMSLIMMVFTLVPAVGPLLGAGIIAISDWRGIFVAFMCFSIVSMLWMGLRLPETLVAEKRRPFQIKTLAATTVEFLSYKRSRVSIICQTLMLGLLFGLLSTVHPIYDVTFDRAESFPRWFGVISLLAGTASMLNAALVVRVGMRTMILVAFAVQVILSLIMLLVSLWHPDDSIYFPIFVIWQTSVFFLAGLTLGNLTALAMEPVGHIAGLVASIMGGLSTVMAAAIAAPIGLMFVGTPAPLAAASVIMCAIATAAMLWLRAYEAKNSQTE
ncbi:multidrug effflux MFS transporter [Planktotalea sp.]|uniref:multidrug effflux MFS transporter n=1 Tax=Planktotalea sp. TaxID=2029877 RepID=UPI003D6BAAAA